MNIETHRQPADAWTQPAVTRRLLTPASQSNIAVDQERTGSSNQIASASPKEILQERELPTEQYSYIRAIVDKRPNLCCRPPVPLYPSPKVVFECWQPRPRFTADLRLHRGLFLCNSHSEAHQLRSRLTGKVWLCIHRRSPLPPDRQISFSLPSRPCFCTARLLQRALPFVVCRLRRPATRTCDVPGLITGSTLAARSIRSLHPHTDTRQQGKRHTLTGDCGGDSESQVQTDPRRTEALRR